MKKLTNTIVVTVALTFTIWSAYNYGKYHQTRQSILRTQVDLLSDLSLGIKAINLLDEGEIVRARAMQMSLLKSNRAFLDTWETYDSDLKWWHSFVPSATSTFWVDSKMREAVKQTKMSVMAEYDALK